LEPLTHLIKASTPALAAADGTTNPDPDLAYIVVIARKLAPVIEILIY
jgi:hypothetical protein